MSTCISQRESLSSCPVLIASLSLLWGSSNYPEMLQLSAAKKLKKCLKIERILLLLSAAGLHYISVQSSSRSCRLFFQISPELLSRAFPAP